MLAGVVYALVAGLMWGLVFVSPLLLPEYPPAVQSVGRYLAFGLIYWLYRGIRRREGIGYGDIKFLAALGAWHGWEVLPQLVLIAAILACAAVTALILCTRTRQTLHHPLPFGPFLAAAGVFCGWQTFISQPL